MSVDFSRNLVKGKVAEVIFEQMIRDEGRYEVIPFGYEHTMPTLAQYRHLVEVRHIIDNIADAPDFALVSEDKTKLYLVEVKYQSALDLEQLKAYAQKLLARWEYPWLFVATPQGFYCGQCKWILDENRIADLSENWVLKDRQTEYLKLLGEFINPPVAQ